MTNNCHSVTPFCFSGMGKEKDVDRRKRPAPGGESAAPLSRAPCEKAHKLFQALEAEREPRVLIDAGSDESKKE